MTETTETAAAETKGRVGSLRIVVDLGAGDRALAHEVFVLDSIDGEPVTAAEIAPTLLGSWKRALERAQATLDAFGWQGVAGDLLEEAAEVRGLKEQLAPAPERLDRDPLARLSEVPDDQPFGEGDMP
jgi:hypothetical protein